MITLTKPSNLWSCLAIMLSASLFFGWVAGLLFTFCVSLLRAWYNTLGRKTFDVLDIVATVTGSLVGTILYLTKGIL